MSAIIPLITPRLVFDALTHTYTLEGVRIPHVTQIIRDAGLTQGAEFFTKDSRERGINVHLAAQYLAEDDLDWDTLADDIRAYVEAVPRFWAETGIAIPFTETPLAHPILKFAGTPDVPIGIINGEQLVIDYKTGTYRASHAIQLAALVELVKANAENFCLRETEIPKRGLIVALQADGRYQIHDPRTEKNPITQAQAWAVFQSALTLFRFKEANGYASDRQD